MTPTAYGEFHCGFTEESYRISLLIKNEMTKKGLSDIEHIFLCGHSLGGAVAAISEKLLRTTINELSSDQCKVSTYIYGSPRYSDISSYISSPYPPAIQIRRLGDMVPFVPLKKMGYTDHPYSFNTNGKTDKYKLNDRWLPYMWFPFFIKKVEPHSMESYRKELAKTAEVDALDLSLISLEKLSKIDSSDKE
ncbi:hypothetical protein HMY34_17325 [Thiothrix subterranea]|uniref:lipase family protein n=1 Tax=Thiothrix subterranea TaxID=2735563 RepID=UPI00192AA219|nr:lipase family protein [Thiothrix subterranea]QQZ30374.1 hypothetical protein HMY34_17325 [Thiothrix subterranea]